VYRSKVFSNIESNLRLELLREKEPSECEIYQIEAQQFKFCEYENAEGIGPWGDKTYALFDHNPELPMLILGCIDIDKEKHKGANNPNCVGESKLTDTVYIRYMYSVQHVKNAFLIDQAIRHIVMHFYNLAQEEENVGIHAQPR